MKKSILAVCDSEPEYASHFLDYMNRSGEKGVSFPFEIAAFSDGEALKRYCGENRVQLLLISQSMYEQGKPWEAEQVMILTEDGEGPPGSGRIGKYQSIEGIMRRVLEAADTGLLPPIACGDGQGRMNLIGIYSPVGPSNRLRGRTGQDESDRHLFTGWPVSSNHIFFHNGPASGPQTQGIISEF